MHKLSKLAAVLLAGALLTAPAFAADKAEKAAAAPAKSGAFATVNGVAIAQGTADAFMAEQKTQGMPDSPEMLKAVKEELVRREVLAQAAKKKGFDKKPAVAAQMELSRQAVLIRAYIQDYAKSHPVTDEQLKQDYEKIKAKLGGTEYKARHILVEKEDEAKAIIDNLKKGAKFEELAKQSKDPGSKDNGGDLGWTNPGSFVKPFSEAMVKLEKGKYTEAPVKSEFGYHVIMLDDTRSTTPPAFDAIKPQLAQRAQQQQIEKMVADLRAKAKVE